MTDAPQENDGEELSTEELLVKLSSDFGDFKIEVRKKQARSKTIELSTAVTVLLAVIAFGYFLGNLNATVAVAEKATRSSALKSLIQLVTSPWKRELQTEVADELRASPDFRAALRRADVAASRFESVEKVSISALIRVAEVKKEADIRLAAVQNLRNDEEKAAKTARALADLVSNKDQLTTAVLQDKEFQKSVAAGLSVPVGTVVAWPTKAKLDSHWRICDGKSFDAARISDEDRHTLRLALQGLYGKDHLPNFKGMFLRGADGTDSQETKPFGERQGHATAMPSTRFVAHHSLDLQDHDHGDLYLRQGGGSGTLKPGGPDGAVRSSKQSASLKDHTHPVRGGDRETRPVNYAVHWVIRVK